MITLLAALLAAATPAPAAKSSTKWVAMKAKIWETVNMTWTARHYQGKDNFDGDSDAKLGPRLSPPIPAVWPPTGKGGYFVYAFAAGPRPSLHDGEEVGAPWARATIDGANQRVDDLGQLKRLGMQGVRALGAPETEIAHTADAAAQVVVTLTRTPAPKPVPKPAPIVQRYYCQWSFYNAVVAAELQRLHPDFWKWLGCP